MACSSDSDEEFCQHVDTTCTPINICKTCTRNIPHGTGSTCNQVSQFPHARIDEYGVYKLEEANNMDDHIFMVKAEIATRGPVTAGIAGHHLKNYTGGILYDDELLRNIQPTHEVSIVGWDVDDETGVEYWIIRNSWGEYWGEMSFFRLQLGTNMLGVEKEISWATIYDFSIENVPCYEDGRNCNMAALSFVPGVGQMS
jgi:cathepsin X